MTRALGLTRAPDGALWTPLADALERSARDLRLRLADAGLSAGRRVPLDRIEGGDKLAAGFEDIRQALLNLEHGIEANKGRDAELDLLGPRANALREAATVWMKAATEPAPVMGENGAAPTVRWVNVSILGAQFHATPLSFSDAFARARERQSHAWVLTSATLTTAGSFDSFLAEMGLGDAQTAQWESPFEFEHQALLYLPEDLPNPLGPDFPEQVADAAWPLIETAGGRTFVLCTTLRAVDRVAARLRDHLEATGMELPLLIQGTGTRRALIDQFRSAGNAILVGSVSFWEGIDIRGDALSLVVIDKLPFAPPDDPVVEAKIRWLKTTGRNAFMEFQLPAAVTLLKQGVGRLIRDENDRGVLMILDERLVTKPYGRTVIASLPPFARTRRLSRAIDFLERPADEV